MGHLDRYLGAASHFDVGDQKDSVGNPVYLRHPTWLKFTSFQEELLFR